LRTTLYNLYDLQKIYHTPMKKASSTGPLPKDGFVVVDIIAFFPTATSPQ